MSVSTEDNIRQLLTDDVARIIAEYCKTPHSSAEIVSQVLRKKGVGTRRGWERIVSNNLIAMERNGAIVYTGGKWKTAQKAIDVLAKYFGL